MQMLAVAATTTTCLSVVPLEALTVGKGHQRTFQCHFLRFISSSKLPRRFRPPPFHKGLFATSKERKAVFGRFGGAYLPWRPRSAAPTGHSTSSSWTTAGQTQVVQIAHRSSTPFATSTTTPLSEQNQRETTKLPRRNWMQFEGQVQVGAVVAGHCRQVR